MTVLLLLLVKLLLAIAWSWTQLMLVAHVAVFVLEECLVLPLQLVEPV